MDITETAARVKSLLDVIDNSLAEEELDCEKLGLDQGEDYVKSVRAELAALTPLLLAAPELLAEALSRLQALEVCEEETGALSCYFYSVGTEQTDQRYSNADLISDIAAVLAQSVQAVAV
jgi:hypothetical protein